MNFSRLGALAAALTVVIASVATPSVAKSNDHPNATPTPSVLAPADRYFGTARMSPIGIRQAIVYLDHMYEWRTMSDEDIVTEAQPVEQSLRAWGNQFPKDPWLPPTAYHLMQLYAGIQTSDARAHAFTMMYYIVNKWPTTKEANLCREQLTQGFPPFHDEPPLRPTPSPSPSSS